MSKQPESFVNPVTEKLKTNDQSPSTAETLTQYSIEKSPSPLNRMAQTQVMNYFPHPDTVLPKELSAIASKLGGDALRHLQDATDGQSQLTKWDSTSAGRNEKLFSQLLKEMQNTEKFKGMNGNMRTAMADITKMLAHANEGGCKFTDGLKEAMKLLKPEEVKALAKYMEPFLKKHGISLSTDKDGTTMTIADKNGNKLNITKDGVTASDNSQKQKNPEQALQEISKAFVDSLLKTNGTNKAVDKPAAGDGQRPQAGGAAGDAQNPQKGGAVGDAQKPRKEATDNNQSSAEKWDLATARRNEKLFSKLLIEMQKDPAFKDMNGNMREAMAEITKMLAHANEGGGNFTDGLQRAMKLLKPEEVKQLAKIMEPYLKEQGISLSTDEKGNTLTLSDKNGNKLNITKDGVTASDKLGNQKNSEQVFQGMSKAFVDSLLHPKKTDR